MSPFHTATGPDIVPGPASKSGYLFLRDERPPRWELLVLRISPRPELPWREEARTLVSDPLFLVFSAFAEVLAESSGWAFTAAALPSEVLPFCVDTDMRLRLRAWVFTFSPEAEAASPVPSACTFAAAAFAFSGAEPDLAATAARLRSRA